MKPLIFIGSFLFAVSSCAKKSPVGSPTPKSNSVSDNGHLPEDVQTMASVSEHPTSRLLRDTIIPVVDWPEQSIADRLTLIDHEASKIGLSVEMSPGLRSRALTYPALRVRNVPFVVAIQATLDSTILRVRIKDSGVLFFYLASEERSSPIPREANGPFSDK